jgi:Family of unknown function (DUF5677)
MKEEPSDAYLSAVSSLMVESRKFLDGLDLIPRRSSAADSILLALLSKSIVLVEAIVVLVSHGFGDEAYGLCRTCLEIELTIRYLTNKDTIQRCTRYYLYFAKDKNEWFRLIKKYYPTMDLKPRSDTEEIEKLAAAYKSPHKWHECPNGLKDFASEPDSFNNREDGSPLDELFYYEVLYKWMSHYVHATVTSIDPEHITLPGDTFKVHSGVGSADRGASALRSSFLNVHLNLLRVFRYFNMTVPESLKDQYENAVSTYLGHRSEEAAIP